jgi:acyl-CoA thioester hydrolase
MGIAHHSNYIRWFEEARVDYLESLGFGYKAMEEHGIISPVISVECQYKKMSHFGDVLAIHTRVESYNGVKLYIRYEITDNATGELRAIGKSGHCFLDSKGGICLLKKSNPEFHQCLASLAQEEII